MLRFALFLDTAAFQSSKRVSLHGMPGRASDVCKDRPCHKHRVVAPRAVAAH